MASILSFLEVYSSLLPRVMPKLLEGVVMTIVVTLICLAISLIIGLLVAAVRMSGWRPLRSILGGYVELMRIVPVLTVLFILYFGLSYLEVKMTAFTAVILGISLWGVAYMSENYRAGIEAIDRGQTEAALAMGLTRPDAMRFVVIPQAIRVVIPTIANFGVGLVKFSSIGSTIGVLELLYNGRAMINTTLQAMHIMLLIAVMYLILSLPLALLAARLQANLRGYQVRRF